ncbi:MAG TPA: iron ABC transporter permease [Desulfosalsimonadaceae bacterium]|nr:iron ABC transporter permease [Desulfosalsimonadaceae bacterium]
MQSRRFTLMLTLLAAAVLLIMLASVFIGRYPEPFWMPPALMGQDPLAKRLLLSLRLPRLLTALTLGMTLSAAGSVLQMIFRNPLVEPGFLGVSQGAAFGAALSILWFSSHPVTIELSATFFGLLGLLTSYWLSTRVRFGGWILRLILSGIAVSAIFSSGIGILKYIADPLSELPEITFWLLGGLYRVTWQDFVYVLPFAAVGLVTVWLMRWRLNLLCLHDATAFSLGASLTRERLILLVTIISATAALTAISGIIGWVGLIIPHIARRLAGASAEKSLPVAMLLGGGFTVASDTLARTMLAGEIPLGILTSAIGAVLFIYLMMSMGWKARHHG